MSAPPSSEARMEPSDCGRRNLDFDQRVHHQRGIDSHQELFKAGALKRRDENRFAIAGEVGEFLGRDEIDLVQDLDDGLGRDSKLGQNFFNLSFLLFADRAGCVLDVEKNFRSLNLFKGGAKAGNECGGKVADEADSIGEQDLAAGRKLQLPEFGIESSEHASRFEHAGLGEGVEESALAGVGVADEGDDGDREPPRGAAAADGGCGGRRRAGS